MSKKEPNPQNPLEEHVKTALRQWHGDSNALSPLSHLYLYRQAKKAGGKNSRQSTNKVLFQVLQELEKEHSEDAKFIQRRFLDEEPMRVIVNDLNVSEGRGYEYQRQAIRRLTFLLDEAEEASRQEQQIIWKNRVTMTTYTNLIGVESHQRHLIEQIKRPDAPWVVGIEGLGGIGKTSLADSLIRYAIQECLFDDIAWVSAKDAYLTSHNGIQEIDRAAITREIIIHSLISQLMPEFPLASVPIDDLLKVLKRRLSKFPHLIVVDNLETTEGVKALLPILEDLSNPTKFLLTSREQIPAYRHIYRFVVPELSEQYAFDLIRQEAAWNNIDILVHCKDDELQPIYEIVGGNPLALRLVVGLMQRYSLKDILENLAEAKGKSAEDLYNFIYWQAWHKLNLTSQQVFLAMPLISHLGDDIDFLSGTTGMEKEELQTGIAQLIAFNLVNAYTTLSESIYSIHSLTRTFLLKQALKW